MANGGKKPREDFVYDRARRVFDRIPTVPEHQEAYLPKPENKTLLRELLAKYGIDHGEIVKELSAEFNTNTTMGESNNPFAPSNLGEDPFQAQIMSIPGQDEGQGLWQ